MGARGATARPETAGAGGTVARRRAGVVPADPVVMAGLSGFRSVRGHDATVALLRHAIAHDRVPSVYLFAGPAGVGKDRLAHALAQVLNCKSVLADGDACGVCEACAKIARAVHPDVIVIQRDRKEPIEDGPKDSSERRRETERDRARRLEDVLEADLRPNITVEQIDELQARLPFRPHEGGNALGDPSRGRQAANSGREQAPQDP